MPQIMYLEDTRAQESKFEDPGLFGSIYWTAASLKADFISTQGKSKYCAL